MTYIRLPFRSSFWKYWSLLASWLAVPPSLPKTLGLSSGDGLSFEEKYNYLAEYGTHVLCLLHAGRGCTYVSRNFESATGFGADRPLGERFFDLIHPDYRTRFMELLGADATPQPWHCKILHADGQWQWYRMIVRPKPGKKAADYICVMENIHEAVLAQHTLQKAKLEAELALRSRSEFLSNMSHDLRTPLNAIIGFSQIIESEIFGKLRHSQYREYIRHIHESGYDLLAKIEDLLDIANIDAGRVTLTREEASLRDILEHVVRSQAHHALSAHVRIDVMEPPELLLYADRLKIQHILGHLVGNAIKFSSPGGSVILQAELAEDGLRFSVSDTGTGMGNTKLRAITEALQADNCWTAAGGSQSIGLGLALTREFVSLHGGRVGIDSRLGEGTLVTISLPPECVRQTVSRHDEYLAHAV